MSRVHGFHVGVFAIVLAIGFGFSPGPVHAQEQAHGEFNLSQRVHWGAAVLPSGNYRYFLDAGSQRTIVRVFQKGGSFSGLFLPKTFSKVQYSGPSRILLERRDGEVFVASMYVGSLGAKLNFTAFEGDANALAGVGASEVSRSVISDPPAGPTSEFFTILNPNKENIPVAAVQKIYLLACAEVEKKVNWATPIRPRLVLRLGAQENELNFPSREVRLKKWDDFRFAEGVVDLALFDLFSSDERAKLSNRAVNQAGATVNLCELKHCVN